MTKCIICDQKIQDDSQYINGNYYHNKCIIQLRKENTVLKQALLNIRDTLKDYNDFDSFYQISGIKTTYILHLIDIDIGDDKK